MTRILSIDQGTTGTTALVLDHSLAELGRGYREFRQYFPQPGWVEHDLADIWRSVEEAIVDACDAAGCTPADIDAVGITNQRETVVAWDMLTGAELGSAIVWQDRRTADRCSELQTMGEAERIRELTGLPCDPYFSATKMEWLVRERDSVAKAAAVGTLRFGTIDSWLVWRLSGGAAHITDASNASRTMLYDIHTGEWSDVLCTIFGIERSWLPTVVDSAGHLADCDGEAIAGLVAPVNGIAGDQQAALFGQGCLERGAAKATYGTGAFVVVNAGAAVPHADGLIATVAWQLNGQLTYALEAAVFTAGAAVQWLRDGLGLVPAASELEAICNTVTDSGGVVLVPAFAGLGAPVWNAQARAALLGLTRGSGPGEIARATLEGIACRVRQNVDAMAEAGVVVEELRVDGGMTNNNMFLQLQADLLDVRVHRPTNIESTARGAAMLAALGHGVCATAEEAVGAWHVDVTFEPTTGGVSPELYPRFMRAVTAVEVFADDRVAVSQGG